MAWGYWSATTVDRGRSPRRNTQCTPLPVNLMQQEEDNTCNSTQNASAAAAASANNSNSGNGSGGGGGGGNSNTCPNTPSGTQANLCYSPTCRSRCSSPCPGSPCPGSPCGSITPPPPPQLTSSQQHLHQHSNKNCPAAQQILNLDDYPSRRQSLDRLDSPQVSACNGEAEDAYFKQVSSIVVVVTHRHLHTRIVDLKKTSLSSCYLADL